MINIEKLKPEQVKMLFDALIEETKQTRSEIMAIQAAQRSLSNYSVAIAGVVVPTLIAGATTTKFNNQVFIIAFFALSVVYEFVALVYVGLTRGILRLSRYLIEYLAPKINSVIGLDYAVVFQWEQFVRVNIRKSKIELVGFAFYAAGEFALIIGPSLVSIALAIFLIIKYSSFVMWHWGLISIYMFLMLLIAISSFYTVMQSRQSTIRFPLVWNND